MLYFEWKEEDAIKYAKEEGAKLEREKMIRMFSKINTPEQIAETLQVSKQYVLDVLKDDGTIMACESTHPYVSSKKE